MEESPWILVFQSDPTQYYLIPILFNVPTWSYRGQKFGLQITEIEIDGFA